MALLWMNAARNSLSVASSNYAKLQREMDKYNKLFQTYARANPETQIRAASVMRQALNEYNSLKAQQENNALKIYEAQQWVNYYNNTPSEVKAAYTPVPADSQELNIVPWVEIDSGTYQEEPVIQEASAMNNIVSVPTSWVQSIVNAASAQSTANDAALNAINNTQTWRYFTNLNNQNKVRNFSTPASIQNILASQRPKYANTTLNQNTSSWTKNLSINPYWQWNIATGGASTINSSSSLVNSWKKRNISNRNRFRWL